MNHPWKLLNNTLNLHKKLLLLLLTIVCFAFTKISSAQNTFSTAFSILESAPWSVHFSSQLSESSSKLKELLWLPLNAKPLQDGSFSANGFNAKVTTNSLSFTIPKSYLAQSFLAPVSVRFRVLQHSKNSLKSGDSNQMEAPNIAVSAASVTYEPIFLGKMPSQKLQEDEWSIQLPQSFEYWSEKFSNAASVSFEIKLLEPLQSFQDVAIGVSAVLFHESLQSKPSDIVPMSFKNKSLQGVGKYWQEQNLYTFPTWNLKDLNTWTRVFVQPELSHQTYANLYKISPSSHVSVSGKAIGGKNQVAPFKLEYPLSEVESFNESVVRFKPRALYVFINENIESKTVAQNHSTHQKQPSLSFHVSEGTAIKNVWFRAANYGSAELVTLQKAYPKETYNSIASQSAKEAQKRQFTNERIKLNLQVNKYNENDESKLSENVPKCSQKDIFVEEQTQVYGTQEAVEAQRNATEQLNILLQKNKLSEVKQSKVAFQCSNLENGLTFKLTNFREFQKQISISSVMFPSLQYRFYKAQPSKNEASFFESEFNVSLSPKEFSKLITEEGLSKFAIHLPENLRDRAQDHLFTVDLVWKSRSNFLAGSAAQFLETFLNSEFISNLAIYDTKTLRSKFSNVELEGLLKASKIALQNAQISTSKQLAYLVFFLETQGNSESNKRKNTSLTSTTLQERSLNLLSQIANESMDMRLKTWLSAQKCFSKIRVSAFQSMLNINCTALLEALNIEWQQQTNNISVKNLASALVVESPTSNPLSNQNWIAPIPLQTSCKENSEIELPSNKHLYSQVVWPGKGCSATLNLKDSEEFLQAIESKNKSVLPKLDQLTPHFKIVVQNLQTNASTDTWLEFKPRNQQSEVQPLYFKLNSAQTEILPSFQEFYIPSTPSILSFDFKIISQKAVQNSSKPALVSWHLVALQSERLQNHLAEPVHKDIVAFGSQKNQNELSKILSSLFMQSNNSETKSSEFFALLRSLENNVSWQNVSTSLAAMGLEQVVVPSFPWRNVSSSLQEVAKVFVPKSHKNNFLLTENDTLIIPGGRLGESLKLEVKRSKLSSSEKLLLSINTIRNRRIEELKANSKLALKLSANDLQGDVKLSLIAPKGSPFKEIVSIASNDSHSLEPQQMKLMFGKLQNFYTFLKAQKGQLFKIEQSDFENGKENVFYCFLPSENISKSDGKVTTQPKSKISLLNFEGKTLNWKQPLSVSILVPANNETKHNITSYLGKNNSNSLLNTIELPDSFLKDQSSERPENIENVKFVENSSTLAANLTIKQDIYENENLNNNKNLTAVLGSQPPIFSIFSPETTALNALPYAHLSAAQKETFQQNKSGIYEPQRENSLRVEAGLQRSFLNQRFFAHASLGALQPVQNDSSKSPVFLGSLDYAFLSPLSLFRLSGNAIFAGQKPIKSEFSPNENSSENNSTKTTFKARNQYSSEIKQKIEVPIQLSESIQLRSSANFFYKWWSANSEYSLNSLVYSNEHVWYPSGISLSQGFAWQPSDVWQSELSANIQTSENYSLQNFRRWELLLKQNAILYRKFQYQMNLNAGLGWQVRSAVGTSATRLPLPERNAASPYSKKQEGVFLAPEIVFASTPLSGTEYELSLRLNTFQTFAKAPRLLELQFTHWFGQDIGNMHKTKGYGSIFGSQLNSEHTVFPNSVSQSSVSSLSTN